MTAETTKSRHIPALDGVRGFAVLLVVALHLGGGAKSSNVVVHVVGSIIKYGWTGVTLFFVLSGFLITGILWESRGSSHYLRNFYARRLLRIWPLYYLALLLVLLSAAYLGHAADCLRQIWVFVLNLQNVPSLTPADPSLHSFFSLNHFWSLAVEEQFYLLWPFLLLLTRNRRQARMLCLTVFSLSAIARLFYGIFSTTPSAQLDSLWMHCGALALGAYLALCFRTPQWSRIERSAPYVFPLALAAFLAAVYGTSAGLNGTVMFISFMFLFISLFWAALIALCLKPGALQSLFQMAWLRWIGKISYGLYVYHLLLINVTDLLTHKLYGGPNVSLYLGLRFLVGVTFSILVAWASFEFFEQPISRLKRHFPSHGIAATKAAAGYAGT